MYLMKNIPKISMEEQPNLPDFLYKCFKFSSFRNVNLDIIFVGLLPIGGGRAKYVPVTETPHFMLARYILLGESIETVRGYKDYAHYIAVNPRINAENNFSKLIKSIRDIGYDPEKGPILVFRSWRRLFPLKRWDVADGFHRLAILAAIGERSVLVGELRTKRSLIRRLRDRFCQKLKEILN